MPLNAIAVKVLGAVIVVLGLLLIGHHIGAQGVQAAWDKDRLAQEAATVATNRAMLRGFENAAESNRKEKENAKAENDKLRAAVATGARRLSVRITSCEQPNGTGTGNQQARAELVPQVAERIIGVGIDGDDAVRDLNACIDKYQALKNAIEGGK